MTLVFWERTNAVKHALSTLRPACAAEGMLGLANHPGAPGAGARAAAAYRGVSMLSVAPRLLLQRLADVLAARDGKRQIRQYAQALGVRHVTLAYEAVQANPRAEMLRLLGEAGIATAGLPAELGEAVAQKRTPEVPI